MTVSDLTSSKIRLVASLGLQELGLLCPPKSVKIRIESWSLTRKLKELWFFNSFSNYDRIGSERFDEKTRVPKGHLAVYFGEEDDDVCRVLVPVVYLNHPLFGDLLREAEKVYGFDHQGCIHVPCRLSEFEDVQTRICAASGYDR
ncbi:hypothetical protein E3N88_24809 [Mikania micrantha]|uniref:Uncharacterized protein n=1 Tax=Mikania micrantha TaxID=192012 RepID=A0A5N6N5S6_9ASTR|nr:hypothetical protein E3N88_24809 [Mikania micrantha]